MHHSLHHGGLYKNKKRIPVTPLSARSECPKISPMVPKQSTAIGLTVLQRGCMTSNPRFVFGLFLHGHTVSEWENIASIPPLLQTGYFFLCSVMTLSNFYIFCLRRMFFGLNLGWLNTGVWLFHFKLCIFLFRCSSV